MIQSSTAAESPRFNLKIDYHGPNPGGRVCSDCNTSSTPLWRSGPQGPKSLCNACGIRRRKTAAAAAAAAVGVESQTIVREGLGKGKKLRDRCEEERCGRNEKKVCLRNIEVKLRSRYDFSGGLAQDVEEAAILLMEMSCGLVTN